MTYEKKLFEKYLNSKNDKDKSEIAKLLKTPEFIDEYEKAGFQKFENSKTWNELFTSIDRFLTPVEIAEWNSLKWFYEEVKIFRKSIAKTYIKLLKKHGLPKIKLGDVNGFYEKILINYFNTSSMKKVEEMGKRNIFGFRKKIKKTIPRTPEELIKEIKRAT